MWNSVEEKRESDMENGGRVEENVEKAGVIVFGSTENGFPGCMTQKVEGFSVHKKTFIFPSFTFRRVSRWSI